MPCHDSVRLAFAMLMVIGIPAANAQQPDLWTLEPRAEDFASLCRFIRDESPPLPRSRMTGSGRASDAPLGLPTLLAGPLTSSFSNGHWGSSAINPRFLG